ETFRIRYLPKLSDLDSSACRDSVCTRTRTRPQTRYSAPALLREISSRRRTRLPSILLGEWRPKNRTFNRHYESTAQVCSSATLPYRGGAVNHCKRKRLHRYAGHAGHYARSRWLCYDAQQTTSLVYLHGPRGMPNVCNL